jgi:hypothetical protein
MNGRSRNQTLIYIFAIVGILVAISLVYQLLTASLPAWISLVAGSLMLLGNAPDLMRTLQQRELGVAMMNTLIGLALVSFFIGEIVLAPLFWTLTLVLLVAAAPLALNKSAVARRYLGFARAMAGQARALLRSRQRTY